MWHEVYSPRTMADVAWSHQKVTELSNWFRSYMAGPLNRVLLLSGPSGCGKLSTLQAMFANSSTSSSSSSSSPHPSASPGDIRNVQLHVFHGVEGGVEELSSFLGSSRIRSHRSSAGSEEESFGVFVVKSLPFDGAVRGDVASRQQATVRAVLLQHLRQLQEQNALNAAAACFPVASLTIFICTIHDVHSEKVAINDYFGPAFANSPLVHKFRCTGVTEKNMAARLTTIVKQQRRVLVNEKLLNVLCASAHGDMRQALLQLEWALLTAPKADVIESSAPAVKRNRSGPVASRTTKKKMSTSTVLDLIDDAGDDVPAAAVSSGGGSELSTVFCRDECIDIAHGAARLLTQKYTIEQLRAVISVPPWKVFAYFTNNMLSYFHGHQIDKCSDVSRIASAVEPAVLELTERAFSAARSIDEGHLNMSVAEMAIVILSVAYRALQKDPKAQAFAPHKPPPFQPSYFPKFLERTFTTSGPSAGGGIFEQNDSDAASDHDVVTRFQAVGGAKFALLSEYGLAREHVMCGDRRTCPLVEFALDYFPFAKRIVLEDPTTAASSAQHQAAKQSSPMPAMPLKAAPQLPTSLGPRRTMFVPSAPAAAVKQPIEVAGATFAALTSFDAGLRSAKLRSGGFFCHPTQREGGLTSARPAATFLVDDIEDFTD